MIYLSKMEVSTPQDLCDYTRCLKSEEMNNVEVYTFDIKDTRPSSEHHIMENWNGFGRSSRHCPILLSLKNKLSEVTLDFTWMPPAYCDTCLSSTFYSEMLPIFGNEKLS
jgi:hypothetical protein